jgi:hypothetical protein
MRKTSAYVVPLAASKSARRPAMHAFENTGLGTVLTVSGQGDCRRVWVFFCLCNPSTIIGCKMMQARDTQHAHQEHLLACTELVRLRRALFPQLLFIVIMCHTHAVTLTEESRNRGPAHFLCSKLHRNATAFQFCVQTL